MSHFFFSEYTAAREVRNCSLLTILTILVLDKFGVLLLRWNEKMDAAASSQESPEEKLKYISFKKVARANLDF